MNLSDLPAAHSGRTRIAGLALLLAVAIGATGCVRSKAVITSTPPKADVMMNDVHVGRTPVEVPFTWYWYYDFAAVKEGYEPAYQRRRFHAPPYLWPGLDVVMELMPFPVTDTKHVHLVLEEESVMPDPVFVQTSPGSAGK